MKNLIGICLFVIAIGSTSKALGEIGVTDTEVIIGGHTTESGPMAGAGAGAAQGGAAYYEMINAKGGINGRKIKWIRKDTQSLAPKTVEGVRQLVEEDKVFAVVGSSGPSHIAVVKYLNERKVPDLFFSDGAGAYADLSLKMSFPMYYTWESEGQTVANYVVKTMKGKKACFLQTKDTLGEEYVKGAMKVLKDVNFRVGPTIRVERMGAQADSEVLNFKQEGCDVILTSVYGPLCSSAINYGFSQGYKPTWIISSFNVNTKFIGLLSDSVKDGVISVHNLVRERSLAKDKKAWDDYEALMKKNNIPVSGISATGYTLAEVFTETLRRAGKNLTREGILEAATSFDGTWKCSLCLNPLRSSPSNHFAFGPGKLLITKNKEWTFVEN